MRKRAGIKLNRDGLEVLTNTGERLVFSSIEEFIASPYSHFQSAFAICRDLLLVRKWKFPKEAENSLREAIALNMEDIFPYHEGELEFLYQIIGADDENIELLIIAIEAKILERLKKIKSIKIVAPSAYIYPLELEGGHIIVKEKDYNEVVRFENGKLVDWFIDKNRAEVGVEIDLPALLLKILEQKYQLDIKFLDKRLFLNKEYILYAKLAFLMILLFFIPAVGNILYWNYKISSIENKIKEVERSLSEYSKVNDELSLKRAMIEKIGYSTEPLGFLATISATLPKDSWITNFSYEKGKFSITGYTSNPQELESKLKHKFKQLELLTTKKSDSIYEYSIKGQIQ